MLLGDTPNNTRLKGGMMLIKHRIIGAFLCAAIISGQVIPLNADGNVIVIDGLDEVNAQRKKMQRVQNRQQ